jgi:cyclic dehypoxanthinyl futalosine synthase
MKLDGLYHRALQSEPLTAQEGLKIFLEGTTPDLIFIADALRKIHHPGNSVTWMIDRNVNITNVCISGCTFCNFHRKISEEGTYTTTLDEYCQKIDQMILLGGNQLLLQGGMHPKYGLEFYTDLFSGLKQKYPTLKLHALGPPEVVHIARKERLSFRQVLEALIKSGLDSLPGAGAEILSDRVRKEISPGKASSKEWLDVMGIAHELNLLTSATMMFGHIETLLERFEHMVLIRDLQAKKPLDSPGFKAFIPWPFMSEGTKLGGSQSFNKILPIEYVRMIALSRIMLTNIENIQASWLTVGRETGQLALHAGANDLGSIMIEENVVSAAGAAFTMDAFQMQKCISDAGFVPFLRNQAYELIELPEGVVRYVG